MGSNSPLLIGLYVSNEKKIVGGCFIVAIILSIGATVGTIWAVIHFITKYR